MATSFGKAGRYVEDQSLKKARQFVLGCLIAASVCAFISGFSFGVSIGSRKLPSLATLFVLSSCAVVLLSKRFIDKKLDAIERDKISFRKGAVGEAVTGVVLQGLPNDFVVLNDLTTPFGNIDHAVIGPTGVFVIDTKNWRGIVEADGKGGLLLNREPTTKDEVGRLVSTCAETKKKIKTLCGHEPFIRGVLVFTSAHVAADFGSIKYADCVREERLYDYITDTKNSRKLTKEEIDSISRAFEMLAGMDRGFNSAAT